MSAQLTRRARDEVGEAWTAANRPAVPLKLPRWSCNWRQQAYNSHEFVFKMEIPVKSAALLGKFRWGFPLTPIDACLELIAARRRSCYRRSAADGYSCTLWPQQSLQGSPDTLGCIGPHRFWKPDRGVALIADAAPRECLGRTLVV